MKSPQQKIHFTSMYAAPSGARCHWRCGPCGRPLEKGLIATPICCLFQADCAPRGCAFAHVVPLFPSARMSSCSLAFRQHLSLPQTELRCACCLESFRLSLVSLGGHLLYIVMSPTEQHTPRGRGQAIYFFHRRHMHTARPPGSSLEL